MTTTQEPETVPAPNQEELQGMLRAVLQHWRDRAYLENHPLAERVSASADALGVTRGQALRRLLRMAIEAMQPDLGIRANAPEARPYEILCRHYIGDQPIVKVAQDLGVGERQAYRELRRGIEALASIVAKELETGASLDGLSQLHQEVERLARSRATQADLVPLLRETVHQARPLAAQQGSELRFYAHVTSLPGAVNRVMLRQAVLNLLSHMIRHQKGGAVTFEVARRQKAAVLTFAYRPASDLAEADPARPYAISQGLFASLGAETSVRSLSDGRASLTVRLPLEDSYTLLIVDDNAGLTALFTRYLQSLPIRVHSAPDMANALALVDEVRPDVIVLDIMIPEHDGWDILSAIREREAGQRARVVVCSVIDDPELAFALGADAFLLKPVRRAELMATLEQVLGRQDPAEA
ncbi:MAG: ATP-binding response regulator [Anaerolineae bacterium]